MRYSENIINRILIKVTAAIAFFVVAFGVCSIDSDSWIPGFMVAGGGLYLLWLARRNSVSES